MRGKIQRSGRAQIMRGGGRAVFLGSLLLAGCSVTTVPLPLSPHDYDHVDPDLVGLWQGVGYLEDLIVSSPEVVAVKVIPTREGAEIVAIRMGLKGFDWAVGSVSTTLIAGQRYASIELTHTSKGGDWGPLEEGEVVVARYSLRAPGVVDVFYITEEGDSRLTDLETAWLAHAHGAAASETRHPEALHAVLDQATALGRKIGQNAVDRHGALMALLETEDGPNFFSGYYGTFARLEDVALPRLPDAIPTKSDADVPAESAGPATSEGPAGRDAP